MVPADEHLVEENIQSVSYEEQIPEHCETRSVEGVNGYKEESFEEPRICLPISQNQEQTPTYLRTNSIGIYAQIQEHCEMRSIEVFKEESSEESHTRSLEQTPISSGINSIEKDTEESSSEEKQAVYEKSKISELQVGQNIEKVSFLVKQNNKEYSNKKIYF